MPKDPNWGYCQKGNCLMHLVMKCVNYRHPWSSYSANKVTEVVWLLPRKIMWVRWWTLVTRNSIYSSRKWTKSPRSYINYTNLTKWTMVLTEMAVPTCTSTWYLNTKTNSNGARHSPWTLIKHTSQTKNMKPWPKTSAVSWVCRE